MMPSLARADRFPDPRCSCPRVSEGWGRCRDRACVCLMVKPVGSRRRLQRIRIRSRSLNGIDVRLPFQILGVAVQFTPKIGTNVDLIACDAGTWTLRCSGCAFVHQLDAPSHRTLASNQK